MMREIPDLNTAPERNRQPAGTSETREPNRSVSARKWGRIEEHLEYVDQNLGVPNPDFVGQQEYLSAGFPVAIDASHNKSFPHQILVDSADIHQTPQEHA